PLQRGPSRTPRNSRCSGGSPEGRGTRSGRGTGPSCGPLSVSGRREGPPFVHHVESRTGEDNPFVAWGRMGGGRGESLSRGIDAVRPRLGARNASTLRPDGLRRPSRGAPMQYKYVVLTNTTIGTFMPLL